MYYILLSVVLKKDGSVYSVIYCNEDMNAVSKQCNYSLPNL